MKLLIITQKVDQNDDVLGFFHSWLIEFAKHVGKLTVICLEKGEYNLQDNVSVYSLGKEKDTKLPISNFKFLRRITHIIKFYRYVWQKRKDYDTVFIHMNSEYIVLAGWLWKLMNKPVSLWYVHKAIPWQLRIAEKFVQNIFTASKESCNLKSKKIKIVGHGIDIKKFNSDIIYSRHSDRISGSTKGPKNHSDYNIIYVGRISPIKNHELLINAIDILNRAYPRRDEALPRLLPRLGLRVKIIGAPHYDSDKKYLENLKKKVKEKKLEETIKFVGSVPNKDIVKYYQETNLSINLCPTGGVDKVVLESMACGVPVIVLNKTFKDILRQYSTQMILKEESPEELADKIKGILGLKNEELIKISRQLRQVVEVKFSLVKLIKTIIKWTN